MDVALNTLPARFGRIACLDMRGEKVQSPEFRNFDCYVFGNEARGLPREPLAMARPFTIGGGAIDNDTIESLNLATAVNICVYELNR
jgi:RNA methyltransferase, TrmH family